METYNKNKHLESPQVDSKESANILSFEGILEEEKSKIFTKLLDVDYKKSLEMKKSIGSTLR